MCLGIPMRVVEVGEGYARCEGFGERKVVNTLLVGDQPVGVWLLVFLDSAREVLSENEAMRISNGLRAVEMVMRGERDVDHLFADLVGREPPRPDSGEEKKS